MWMNWFLMPSVTKAAEQTSAPAPQADRKPGEYANIFEWLGTLLFGRRETEYERMQRIYGKK